MGHTDGGGTGTEAPTPPGSGTPGRGRAGTAAPRSARRSARRGPGPRAFDPRRTGVRPLGPRTFGLLTFGPRALDLRWSGLRSLDSRVLAVLRAGGDRPAVASAARVLSHAGEHAALWLAAGLTGAAVDPARRPAWLRATAVVAGAHLAGMAVKRVVRRPRPPGYEGRGALVRTAGRHSFPSCHAASATAAVFAFGALPAGPAAGSGAPGAGSPGPGAVPAVVAAAMCVSRVVAGVHYPSDVVAGALIGGLTAKAAAARRPDLRKALTRPGRPQ